MKIFTYYLLLILLEVSSASENECRSNLNAYRKRKNIQWAANTLFVINSNNIEKKSFSKLEHWFSKLKFQVKELPQFCEDGIVGTKIASDTFRIFSSKANVVNFGVKINSINDLKDDVSIVGYSDIKEEEISEETCKTNGSFITILNETYEFGCDVTNNLKTHFNYARVIISNSIKKYPVLHAFLKYINEDYRITHHGYWKNLIDKMHAIEEPLKVENILVCGNKDNNFSFDTKSQDDRIQFVRSCANINNFLDPNVAILAVIAPKPLEGQETTNIPVIFYNTPFLLPEHKVVFPHSTVLYDSYFEMLQQGLLELMKRKLWNRVAIVSDDSPYSDEFEINLTMLFDTTDVMYVSKSCLGLKCKFTEALTALINADARIIIANVDEENSEELVTTAAQLGLVAKAGIMWIFRDWPFQSDTGINILGEAFSLTVAPNSPDSNADSARISEAIGMIHSTINLEESNTRQEFFYQSRLIELDGSSERAPPHVILTKVNPKSEREVIYSYSVAKSEGKLLKDLNYRDLVTECYFRSNKFASPCNDLIPLLILLVVFVFLLSVLLIIVFFRNLRPSYCPLK